MFTLKVKINGIRTADNFEAVFIKIYETTNDRQSKECGDLLLVLCMLERRTVNNRKTNILFQRDYTWQRLCIKLISSK